MTYFYILACVLILIKIYIILNKIVYDGYKPWRKDKSLMEKVKKRKTMMDLRKRIRDYTYVFYNGHVQRKNK
jgi:uncharacterized protein YxeA